MTKKNPLDSIGTSVIQVIQLCYCIYVFHTVFFYPDDFLHYLSNNHFISFPCSSYSKHSCTALFRVWNMWLVTLISYTSSELSPSIRRFPCVTCTSLLNTSQTMTPSTQPRPDLAISSVHPAQSTAIDFSPALPQGQTPMIPSHLSSRTLHICCIKSMHFFLTRKEKKHLNGNIKNSGFNRDRNCKIKLEQFSDGMRQLKCAVAQIHHQDLRTSNLQL